MQCPRCGAEIPKGQTVCDYCGTSIDTQTIVQEQRAVVEGRNLQTQINKQGCPKCGSPNVSFSREKQGEVKSKKGMSIVHSTVGYCKDCGYTWTANEEKPKKKLTWLWVLGWICCYPIPLTIIIVRSQKIKRVWKIVILAAAWLTFIIFFAASGSSSNSSSTNVNNSADRTASAPVVGTDMSQSENETNAPLENNANEEALQKMLEEPVKEQPVNQEPDKEAEEEKPIEIETLEDIGLTASAGEANALIRAQSYLEYSAFSYTGLIGQLEFEGFTTEEATYGADNCGADWMSQAKDKADSYLNYSAFSYTGLIEQLEYEGFTPEEATYGADNCGADWNEQAAKKAESYLSFSTFSRSRLKDQLMYEGFTAEEAEYGVSQSGL